MARTPPYLAAGTHLRHTPSRGGGHPQPQARCDYESAAAAWAQVPSISSSGSSSNIQAAWTAHERHICTATISAVLGTARASAQAAAKHVSVTSQGSVLTGEVGAITDGVGRGRSSARKARSSPSIAQTFWRS